jgi:uncharacterized membrane protein
VSSGTLVQAEDESRQEPELGSPDQDAASAEGAFERWLNARLNLVALGIIAGGFLVRVYVADRGFLNPDEVLHYIILNQRSAFFAYKVSLTNAHPPLIYLLVYYWRFLGRSELMLRFPSVLAGTALCWVAYKWIATVFGKAAGVIGLILIAFLPAMIALSAELRSYAVLLFCETTALYLLETAIQEKSARKMRLFSIFLCLAILSHYSALFFVLTVGIYALARILESRIPRNVIVAWAGGQAGALAICGFLYATHVSKLKHYIAIWAISFDQGYTHTNREHLSTFARNRTMDIFSFMFENQYIARALLLLWIVAIAVLLLREFAPHRENVRFRHVGILLLLPFIAVFGAAVAGYYPYVGSRHTVFLAPFLIAALSFLLAVIGGRKIWAAIVIAALLAGASNTSGKQFEPYIANENQSRTLMLAAVNHLRQTTSPSDLIVADYQSALLLVYYLCGPKVILPVGTFNLPASRVRCNGYSIASFQTWSMDAAFFLSHFEQMAQAQRLKPGDKVQVFEAGWGTTLATQLPLTSPEFRCVDPKAFGANISVIPMAVGSDLSPIAVVTNCSTPALQIPAS